MARLSLLLAALLFASGCEDDAPLPPPGASAAPTTDPAPTIADSFGVYLVDPADERAVIS